MPTVLRIGPYRFFFYSNEGAEPPHIHIQRESMLAKLWLDPVSVASSSRFPAQELNRLLNVVEENQTTLMEAWHEYFGE